MDFIGSCKGRWQRNEVVESKDGRAGFDAKTLRRIDSCKGNGEMREEVGEVVRRKYRPPPFFLSRLQMRVEDFHSAGV